MPNKIDTDGAKIFKIPNDAPDNAFQGHFYIYRETRTQKIRGFDIPIEEFRHSDGVWREGEQNETGEYTAFYSSQSEAETMLKT